MALVGSAAIIFSALAAIPAQAAKPTIVVWVDAPRMPAAKLYADIIKDTVNVKVELHNSNELVQKVSLFNKVKKGWPDVEFSDPNDIGVLKDAKDALALDSYAPASFWSDMQGGNQWCKGSDGKTYCVKNDLAQDVLWVNVKLMKQFKYNVPKTMDDFAKIGADIAKNHPGYSLGALGDVIMYSSFLWPSQCPTGQATSDTVVRIAPTSPKCTRATALVQPMIDSGVLSTQSPDNPEFQKAYAKNDKVVMTIGPSWFGEFEIRPTSSWGVPAGEITAAPMPTWAGEKVNYSGEYGGGIWTVSPHTKYPKEALAFAIFMDQDKRSIVDVLNPDGSHGAPTFPASALGNALWKVKISADKYYAADPYPAMLAQSTKIFPGEKPVSFDLQGAMAGTYANTLRDTKNAQKALEAYATYATNLAKQLGYTVITK